MDVEIWKPVKGYEGLYSVSNLGRVRSERFNKIMSLCPNWDGYNQTAFRKNGKSKTIRVCRLVATHFLENKNKNLEINHKNNIRNDDRAINLEWITHQENIIQSHKTGKASQRGEKNSRNVIPKKDIQKIKDEYSNGGITYQAIADRYGVTKHCIYSIVKGRTWKM